MAASRTDFRGFGPIELVKPNGVTRVYGRGATTDLDRRSALVAALVAATAGDVVNINESCENIDLTTNGQIGAAGVQINIHPRVRVITTHASGIHNGLGTLSYPYCYKIESGLRRFFDALGLCQKTTGGLGMGGIDVCCLGHSRMEFGFATVGPGGSPGANSVPISAYLCDRWTHILKVWLQQYYNPPGVVGGYGYVPVYSGNGSHAYLTSGTRRILTPVGSVSESTGQNQQMGGGEIYTLSDATERAYFQMDGSAANATFLRSKVTGFQVEYRQNTALGQDAAVDIGEGSLPSAGAGGVLSEVLNTRGSLVHSQRSPLYATADPDADNFFALTGATDGDVQCGGFIFYNGDFDCGIRLHNFSRWGISLTTQGGSNHWAGIKRFMSNSTVGSTTAGATNCKLIIMDHIGQDVVSGGDGGETTFKSSLLTYDADLLNEPSKPCILHVIPHYFDDDTQRAIYNKYVEKIYQAADELDHVAVLNLNQKWLHANMANGPDLCGWTGGDTRHDAAPGQRGEAEEIFAVLKR